MAEIILFKDKRGGTAGSTQSAASLAYKTQQNQDWGNQELADLYRVKRLLDQAGVVIETDRGLTDEGDPWFVFCHPDGDVFVHLCRFDGEYLLDSTSIEAPLRGNSFADLINEFVDRAIEKRAANIVPLRPGDGVYLHPAIMLTALIWTMFVASDELIGIAHGAEIDQSEHDFDLLLSAPMPETDGAFGILQAALEERGDNANVVAKESAEPADRETQITSSSTILPNPISLSLSAIAVTFGMSTKSSFEFLQSSKESKAQDTSTLVAELEQALEADAQTVTREEEFANSPDLDSSRSDGTSSKQGSDKAEVSEIHVFNIPNAFSMAHAAGESFDTGKLDIILPSIFDVSFEGQSASSGSEGPTARKGVSTKPNTSQVHEESENNAGTGIRLEIAFGHNVSLSAYQIDNQELFASFDISTIQGFDWSGILGDIELNVVEENNDVADTPSVSPKPTGGTIRATEVTEYTQTAMDFVRYLLSEKDTVEMVVLEGKIILVDLSAFDEITDVSYLRSWTYDDIGIVSTIGHLSDFEAFGLVSA
ncbi:hypothetical protein [Maritalea porphyrae]|uniref:Uncharacterized protein n=1 Tax=Maritalea porphyrae TaxID=880732 RepID=A0ABQ5UPJ3_9HYPH|nr:hypothetical protein [Maritalea porphyrae]GLQ17208.1 hypothetical protein GCM10007879_14570 [Maritalea porphyrae]